MTKVPSEGIFLIKEAIITDPRSAHHLKKNDILIEHGVIVKIGKNLKESFGTKVIQTKGLHVSPGWMDLHVNVQDPGFEYKESIDSALDAAAAGGYTAILSCSTTDPVIDNKSSVEYQRKKSKGHTVDLMVSGSISKGGKGHELAEMYDMHQAGAVAFADFKSAVENTQLLKLALLYTKPFRGLVMLYPKEPYLAANGVAGEGMVSMETGMHGIPGISEEISIQRALKLAEYTGQRIHFSFVTTGEGIDLIKKARRDGVVVSCGVSIANLFFNDSVIADFDANYKLDPPLRDESQRKTLIKALKDRVVDVVVSDHWPQNVERKDCEFERAAFGMISLETCYAMLKTLLGEELNPDRTAELLSFNPRKILGLDVPVIKVGSQANLTLFQPEQKWTYDLSKSPSQSRNSPLHGATFTGKVIGIINNGNCHLNP